MSLFPSPGQVPIQAQIQVHVSVHVQVHAHVHEHIPIHVQNVTLNSKSVTEIDNKLPDNLNGPVLPYRMISFVIIWKVQEVME